MGSFSLHFIWAILDISKSWWDKFPPKYAYFSHLNMKESWGNCCGWRCPHLIEQNECLWSQHCAVSACRKGWWSTFPMRKGWVNWDCSAWRSDCSGDTLEHLPVPDGRLQDRWRETLERHEATEQEVLDLKCEILFLCVYFFQSVTDEEPPLARHWCDAQQCLPGSWRGRLL